MSEDDTYESPSVTHRAQVLNSPPLVWIELMWGENDDYAGICDVFADIVDVLRLQMVSCYVECMKI